MPSTPNQRARERKRKIQAATDAVSLPPRTWRWPSEREMEANIDRSIERTWSSHHYRPDTMPHVHNEKGPRVGGRRADY